MDSVKEGDKVLILWKDQASENGFKSIMEKLKVGDKGLIKLENVNMLSMSQYSHSSFDVIISGTVFPQTISHEFGFLAELIKLLKPEGKLLLHQVLPSSSNPSLLKSNLIMSGYINVSDGKDLELKEEDCKKLKALLNLNENVKLIEFIAEKPNYEIGSSCAISFGGSIQSGTGDATVSDVSAVWKLTDTVDDDLIDEDNLLNDDDLKKPDPAQLKVCGTTGKRKACKNCSCGLAEELAGEKAPPQPSACGNVSLLFK